LLNNKNLKKILSKLITNLVLVVSFSVVGLPIYSQVSETPKELRLKADSLAGADNFDVASILYHESLIKSKIDSNWRESFYAIKGLCNLAIYKKSHKQLVDSMDVYLATFPEDKVSIKAGVYDNIGYALNMLNQVYLANHCFELTVLLKAEILDTTRINSLKSIMLSYGNLALTYANLGDHKSAIEALNNAIYYAKKVSPESLCKYYTDKGKYYFHNNKSELAKKQFKVSIENCEDPVYPYLYLSHIYLEQDSLGKVMTYLKKAEPFLEDYEEVFEYNSYLSKFYVSKKKYLEAEKALAPLFDSTFVFIYQRDELREMVNYARLLFDNKSYEKSLNFVQRALSFHYEIDSSNIVARPIIDNSLPDVWIIEALLIKADYFFMNYKNSLKKSDLEEAEFYFDLAFSYFDELKSKFQSTNSKYRIGSYTQNIYNKLIEFNIEQFNITREEKYFSKAFHLIQNSSAFVLKNSISERKAFEILGVDNDTVQKYLYYKDSWQTEKKLDADVLTSTEFLEFIDFEKRLFDTYPSLKDYYKSEIIDIDQVQKNINNNALVVQYYFFNDKLYSLQVSKNSIQISDHQIDIGFAKKIENYVSLITNYSQNNVSQFSQESNELYEILMANVLENPLYENISQLVIIPDGPIKQVAFNSLVRNPDVRFPSVDDYLVSQYEISYLYYASQLNDYDSKERNEYGFVGFGIEYNDEALQQIIEDYQAQVRSSRTVNPISLKVLKYAAEEVVKIAEFIGGDAFVNENVTYENLIKSIINYQIVHISAHAFLNEENYSESYIALSQDQDEKSKLTYSDILNLNLNNDFVVLSACQTNSGKQIAGEGMMSLSRAFTQSGSKSVMGAYWDSSDRITKDIMQLFYKNLKEGHSKSKSLQLAQLEFLSNDEISTPTFRHPFYWSAWAIYGGNESLTFSSHNFAFYCGIISLILVLGFCAFILIKRKNKRLPI